MRVRHGGQSERALQARLDAAELRRIAREEPRLARDLGLDRAEGPLP